MCGPCSPVLLSAARSCRPGLSPRGRLAPTLYSAGLVCAQVFREQAAALQQDNEDLHLGLRQARHYGLCEKLPAGGEMRQARAGVGHSAVWPCREGQVHHGLLPPPVAAASVWNFPQFVRGMNVSERHGVICICASLLPREPGSCPSCTATDRHPRWTAARVWREKSPMNRNTAYGGYKQAGFVRGVCTEAANWRVLGLVGLLLPAEGACFPSGAGFECSAFRLPRWTAARGF